MSKHTPGPWNVEKGIGVHNGWLAITGGRTSADSPLAILSTVLGEDEVMPDARLIAAAPELLAALEAQESADAYARQYRHIPDAAGDIADAHEQAVEMRRAAIAKAKGE